MLQHTKVAAAGDEQPEEGEVIEGYDSTGSKVTKKLIAIHCTDRYIHFTALFGWFYW